MIVELFSLIPSILLVQLFQRLRPRQLQLSSLRQALYKLNSTKISSEECQTDEKRSKLTFPWWCIFLAYGLCLILVAISILFIIARGIEFGDLKTQKWLASIATGFFSSIFLVQPIKVGFYPSNDI